MTDQILIGDIPIGAAPTLADQVFLVQDPAGVPTGNLQELETIKNLFNADVSGAATGLKIDTLNLVIRGGGLLTDTSTGFCDAGENVKTYVNPSFLSVNKFEKGEVGDADLDFAPGGWDLGNVTPTMKIMDVGGNVLNNCDVAFDAQANVTCTADTSVKVEGTGSAKMACAAGLAAGALIATDVISSMDLTYALHVDMMIRSSVALSAGDLQFLIDNTATCASPTKAWDLPAILANTWTPVSITCGDMSGAGNNAIISVGFKQVVDKGAFDLYADAISFRTNVTMQIAVNAFGPGDNKDIAFPAFLEATGEPGYFTDALLTFAALTVGNTPAAGDRIRPRVGRKNVATEAAGKVCFTGATLLMTRAV